MFVVQSFRGNHALLAWRVEEPRKVGDPDRNWLLGSRSRIEHPATSSSNSGRHSTKCFQQKKLSQSKWDKFAMGSFNIIIMDTSSWYASDEGVSNDFFRHSLDDSQISYLIQVPGPSLNAVDLLVIHNHPCKHSSKLGLFIRFTPSRCLDVQQDWCPVYYPEGMKARVSPVQSIEPRTILTPTRIHSPE